MGFFSKLNDSISENVAKTNKEAVVEFKKMIAKRIYFIKKNDKLIELKVKVVEHEHIKGVDLPLAAAFGLIDGYWFRTDDIAENLGFVCVFYDREGFNRNQSTGE